MRIQELEFQVVSLELEIQQLTVKQQQQPLIFKFCVTDEDFRYYTKFSSKEVFTVFWESVYPSASRLLYWHSKQHKRHLALSENFRSLMNCSCFSVVLQLGFRRKPCQPSSRSACLPLVASSSHGQATFTRFLARYRCG